MASGEQHPIAIKRGQAVAIIVDKSSIQPEFGSSREHDRTQVNICVRDVHSEDTTSNELLNVETKGFYGQ